MYDYGCSQYYEANYCGDRSFLSITLSFLRFQFCEFFKVKPSSTASPTVWDTVLSVDVGTKNLENSYSQGE